MKERNDLVPALIMGLGHPRQTAYVKSLANIGVPVHAIHTKQTALRFSRHLKKLSSNRRGVGKAARLPGKVRPRGGGIIVPTNDDYVALVSRDRLLDG
jgi:hypothetical protein